MGLFEKNSFGKSGFGFKSNVGDEKNENKKEKIDETHHSKHLEKTNNPDNLEDKKEKIEEKKVEEKIEEKKGEKEPEIKITKHAEDLHIDDILQLVIDTGASDLHFCAGEKLSLRVDGHMKGFDEIGLLSEKQVHTFTNQLMGGDPDLIQLYNDTKEMDCAFLHSSGVNFRVNLFVKRKKKAAVLRKIASEALPIEVLGIPDSIKKLLEKKQGMLLVTGPTGSGKSTSMQSMLNYVNDTRVEHILTIEDPIEFIFKDNKSVFSQREVGVDTLSFPNALKAALREDPDIIMIGEMRDMETIEAAMHFAETGHLVISTLHTSSAAQTISRLISTFPSDQQDQVQSRLADSLIGVLSQRLVRKADKKGRVGIYEVMIVNGGVRNIIRTGDVGQMGNAMLSGRSEGMVLMKDYADTLEKEGVIEESEYAGFFKIE